MICQGRAGAPAGHSVELADTVGAGDACEVTPIAGLAELDVGKRGDLGSPAVVEASRRRGVEASMDFAVAAAAITST